MSGFKMEVRDGGWTTAPVPPPTPPPPPPTEEATAATAAALALDLVELNWAGVADGRRANFVSAIRIGCSWVRPVMK